MREHPAREALVAVTPRAEVSRRAALQLIGAGIAALQAGCLEEAGDENIVPYVIDPPEQHPGTMTRYTGMIVRDGFATGVIVESHDGRPTKIDGNPLHPASLGGSLPALQAGILDVYDPQRLDEPADGGVATSWHAIVHRLRHLPRGPLWIVLPPQSSPTLAHLLERVAATHELHVVYAAPLDHRAAYRGHALAYGRVVEQQLELARADAIVALDADALAAMPMSAAWARGFAGRRTPDRRMNRLWVCEPMQTPTGTLADERLAAAAGDVAAIAACVVARLAELGHRGPPLGRDVIAGARRRAGTSGAAWADEVAAELHAHPGAAAVVVGDRQPDIVHALARWIDAMTGSVGGPVTLTEPALIDPLGGHTLADLVDAVASRAVGAVVVIDANPAFACPRAAAVDAALRAAPWSLHVTAFPDETTAACTARMPLAHDLEAWSDGRAWTGTLAVGQPAIRPRFAVASAIEVVAAIAGDDRTPRELVRERFDASVGTTGSAERWIDALRIGMVSNTDARALDVTPRWSAAADAALAASLAPRASGSIEIALAPSLLHDGRHAANAWLQELPHPITKQTWGNAALLGPETAAKLGVADEDVVRLATDAGAIELPALIVAAAAEDAITIELGYGHRSPGLPVARDVGRDGYALQTSASRIVAGRVTATGDSRRIVRTQHTMEQHGRELAPLRRLDDLLRAPDDVTGELRGPQPSLLPELSETTQGVQWGMSIDTSLCTGCSACMVACQAENNIPCVGPDGVADGRHMNWIRIDRYVVDDGRHVVNEPMPCQHCETAPCEYVCPVMATTHSADGLNEQAYQRCIGTRFCSNNCPYKVRRFNWFAYEREDSAALQYNPDVTVRSRGVMEKCTYCVQRIRGAEHRAIVEDRPIRTGEVVTACMQACPTTAIVFGELHETETRFAAMRRDPRRFDALHDLGTRPRTQYLARIRNPRSGT